MDDPLQQLLCPQVTMAVEERQLDIGSIDVEADVPPEAEPSSLPTELQLRLILDNGFQFASTQIPLKLHPIETTTFDTIIQHGGLQKYIATNKTWHCTVCNKHIGSSCVKQFDRYIHPILNVIMCHSCIKFYSVGTFDKDKDGSELYCRWCGQGGTVICCSNCPYVFCQSCITLNLGSMKVRKIQLMDSWKCFVCKPSQLLNLHISTHVLHAHTMVKIREGIEMRDVNILTHDSTTCCPTDKMKERKQSLLKDDALDEDFTPKKQKLKLKKMRKIPPPSNSLIRPGSAALVKKVVKTFPAVPKVPKPVETPLNVLAPNNDQILQQPIPLLKELVSSLYPTANPLKRILPKPTPSHRTSWLVKSVKATQSACNELSSRGKEMEGKIYSSKTFAELAAIHNAMQSAISDCDKKLNETRRKMHEEFLRFLNKMNVVHTSQPQSKTNPLSKKVILDHIDLCDDDDDENDVTLVAKSGSFDVDMGGPSRVNGNGNQHIVINYQVSADINNVAPTQDDTSATKSSGMDKLNGSKLHIKPQLSYHEIVDRNSKLHFNVEHLSIAEFQRAIRARVILQDVNNMSIESCSNADGMYKKDLNESQIGPIPPNLPTDSRLIESRQEGNEQQIQNVTRTKTDKLKKARKIRKTDNVLVNHSQEVLSVNQEPQDVDSNDNVKSPVIEL